MEATPQLLREAVDRFVNERILPGIVAHGGSVEVVELESNIVTLQLAGACVACGIQAFTADAIANYILDNFPELDDVRVLTNG